MNYVILNSWNKRFFQYMQDNNISFEAIVGNHDVPYKNTNEIDGITELFKNKYPNIIVHTKPIVKDFDGTDILLLPWINSENYNDSIALIETTKAPVAFGHLEVAGFEMDRGNICHEGLDRSIFNKFDKVLSGHFHHKSSDGTIEYLGSQYEMTWADYGDPKGFHVFDTDTRDLTFVQNPYKMFYRHVYDEANFVEPSEEEVKNKHVKIIVHDRKDLDKFDKYATRIEKFGPADLSIVESSFEATIELDERIDETKSTLDVLVDAADKLPDDGVKKKDIAKLLKELYMESQEMETE
jgi:DNA repair exonuclease SbcCD nuclease subunit